MARLFNIITIVMLVLAVLVLVWTGVQFLAPAPAEDVLQLPTQNILPTETPTSTPRPTLPPTFTLTPTITQTPSPTLTPTLPPSPSPTITDTPLPTATITDTGVPEPTATFTPSATSSEPTATFTPTESLFPFQVRQPPGIIFTRNTFNTAACQFQAVGGQVLGLSDAGLDGIQVFVFGAGIDRVTTSGFNTAYGPGGWEIPVDTTINNNTYSVELRTSIGTAISDRIEITFPSNCDENIAIVQFEQTRPF